MTSIDSIATKAYDEARNTIKAHKQENMDSTKAELQDIIQQTKDDLQSHVTHLLKETKAEIQSYVNDLKDNSANNVTPGPQPTSQRHMPNTQDQPTVLFPNIRLPQTKPTLRTKPNPYEDLSETPDQEPQDENDEWDRYGPDGESDKWYNQRTLPELQPHKLVQHVRVPYTGRESSYTWYHTFRSAVQQYGILLIPVEQFRKKKIPLPAILQRHQNRTGSIPRYGRRTISALSSDRYSRNGAYRSSQYPSEICHTYQWVCGTLRDHGANSPCSQSRC